jgi:hypothetical protein
MWPFSHHRHIYEILDASNMLHVFPAKSPCTLVTYICACHKTKQETLEGHLADALLGKMHNHD